MATSAETELLEATHALLKAIDAGDWKAYAVLCSQEITCFEPEAEGHLVSGLPFHKFYFDLPGAGTPRQSSASSPHIRVIGRVGIVCYARLVQKLDAQGAPVTACANETRIWQKEGEAWKHIHFHRSPC
jgi:calcium/calmodulin-dependent protein kinase (CaM kinase) II